jgi:hypothetical protein
LSPHKKEVLMNNGSIIGGGRPGMPAAGFNQLHNKVTFHREIKHRGAS